MRAIFINHCHPDCPHVCGTRAREFARALARQGHRIVLLTETLRREDPPPKPGALHAALATHDWSSPFYLAVPPHRSPVLARLRAGVLPRAISAAIVAYQYLWRGGMFTDWRDASRPYWTILAQEFKPEVTWGIFGNTDAWAIAQGIARLAGCPWVRDVKDQWTAFIPASLRWPVAGRYDDAAAATSLSDVNAADAAGWFPGGSATVYSGVSPEIIASSAPVAPTSFIVTLVGAAYEAGALATLVEGVARFLAGGRTPVELHYAGTDTTAVEAALTRLQGKCAIHVHGQLAFGAYAALVARSHLNVYVRTAKTGWWHHKVVELLAVRRPILCVPGEIDEARRLAQSVHGQLLSAADPAAVAAALETVWQKKNAPPSGSADALQTLTWDATAARLAGVLASVTPAGRAQS